MTSSTTPDRSSETEPATAGRSGETHRPASGPGDGPALEFTPTDAVAFLCELAMVATLALGGWRLGGSTLTSLGLAVGLPLVAMVLWGVLLAPRSRRRLPQPGRCAVQCVVFVLAGALAALVGLIWWGLALAVVSCATFAALARAESS